MAHLQKKFSRIETGIPSIFFHNMQMDQKAYDDDVSERYALKVLSRAISSGLKYFTIGLATNHARFSEVYRQEKAIKKSD